MNGLEQLRKKESEALLGGGLERIKKQHASGKLTARERVNALLDPGSFYEIDKFVTHRSDNFGIGEEKYLGDGVIVGGGFIHGRRVFVFAQDFTVFGGSLSATHAQKIVKVMDLAEKTGAPIIGLNDSGGARIQEGVESLGGYADIFLKNTLLSGVVPQVSVILGPCAGGAVYSPAITDFVIMVEGLSHMFITGPDVIKTVTKEEVSKDVLGGAATHEGISGVSHLTASSEQDAFHQLRTLLSYLPQNNLDTAPRMLGADIPGRNSERLRSIVPEAPNQPYDIRLIIEEVADSKTFFELQAHFARNIVTGFVRLDGFSVGVVANQPAVLAGCLDINASVKAARFVRFCDAFNIPILTLVDVPGFLPGVSQEHGGIIRHGAKLLYAYAEATVPKVTLITRKAYGGAYDVMSSKHLRSDVNLAYPGAEIAVMGSEGAVSVIFKREIDAVERTQGKEAAQSLRATRLAEYREKFATPWIAAELGFIDSVVDPKDTRTALIQGFALVKGKSITNPRKKHGNIPL